MSTSEAAGDTRLRDEAGVPGRSWCWGSWRAGDQPRRKNDLAARGG